MRPVFLLSLVFALGLVAGVMWERAAPSKERAEKLTARFPGRLEQPDNQTPGSRQALGLKSTRVQDGEAMVEAADSTEAFAQFSKAFRTQDPIQRTEKLMEILQLMNETNGPVYFEAWLAWLKNDTVDSGNTQLMNRRLGQVMGAQMVTHRIGRSYEMQGANTWLRDQYLGWLETEPEAGRKWLNSLQNEQFREVMVGIYLESAVLSDPAGAASILNTVPPDLQDSYGAKVVAALRSNRPAEEVSDWITNQANSGGENRQAPWLGAATNALMQSVASARLPGENVAKIFERHLGQPGMDLQWGSIAARHFASKDPDRALDWACQMADHPAFGGNTEIIGAAIEGMAPEKLLEFARQDLALPDGAARDTVYRALAERLLPTQPEAAKEVLNRIQNPHLKQDLPTTPAAADPPH